MPMTYSNLKLKKICSSLGIVISNGKYKGMNGHDVANLALKFIIGANSVRLNVEWAYMDKLN